MKATTTPFPVIRRYKDEEFYFDESGKKNKFPSIDDEPSVALSVIIPAYEEEKRLPVMLDECMEFLEERTKADKSFTYEVIVVSDGSKDRTVQCAMKYCAKYSASKFRVMELVENCGKGGAVRLVSLKFAKLKNLLKNFRSRECKAVVGVSCFSPMPTGRRSSRTSLSWKEVSSE